MYILHLINGGRIEKVGLNITPKEFKQLSKWSENIYNTAVVIDYFVANQPEIEECYNLAPVIKHLRNDADILNAFFIDRDKEINQDQAHNLFFLLVSRSFQ